MKKNSKKVLDKSDENVIMKHRHIEKVINEK